MTSNHNSWLPYPCFCVSQVANSIRVIKTKKQTSSENCSYISAAQEIIEKDLLDGIIFGETARMRKISKNILTKSVFFMSISKCYKMTPLLGRWWNGYSGLPEKDSRKLAGQTKIISAKLLLAPHEMLQDGVAGIFFRGLSTRVSWCKFRLISNLRPRSCAYLWLFAVKLGAPQNWKNDTRHMYLIGWWHLKYVFVLLLFEFWFDLVSCGHSKFVEHKNTEPMMWHWLRGRAPDITIGRSIRCHVQRWSQRPWASQTSSSRA